MPTSALRYVHRKRFSSAGYTCRHRFGPQLENNLERAVWSSDCSHFTAKAKEKVLGSRVVSIIRDGMLQPQIRCGTDRVHSHLLDQESLFVAVAFLPRCG